MDEADVASCSGVMKRARSIFIFLTQDLWVLFHQVLQESQVALLSKLDGNPESDMSSKEGGDT